MSTSFKHEKNGIPWPRKIFEYTSPQEKYLHFDEMSFPSNVNFEMLK